MSVQPPTPRQKIRHLLRLFLLVNAIGIGVAVAIWVYGLEIQTVNVLRLQRVPAARAGRNRRPQESICREAFFDVPGAGAGSSFHW